MHPFFSEGKGKRKIYETENFNQDFLRPGKQGK